MKTMIVLACLLATAAAAEEARPRPVNPGATPETHFIVSGSRFTERFRELTGKTPLLWGSDFSFAYQGRRARRRLGDGRRPAGRPDVPERRALRLGGGGDARRRDDALALRRTIDVGP